jgi:hypothetical protein
LGIDSSAVQPADMMDCHEAAQFVMSPEHMKQIWNTWRKDAGSWMRPSSKRHYDWCVEQRLRKNAHDLLHSSFSTYLFQLSGCKFLLHKFIELPIISSSFGSAAFPAAQLVDLVNAFEDHKKAKDYRKAVEDSQGREAGRSRLSRQIRLAQWEYARGRNLSMQKVIEFSDLDAYQQQLIDNFKSGHSADKLDRLLAQKKTPYRGAGAEVL